MLIFGFWDDLGKTAVVNGSCVVVSILSLTYKLGFLCADNVNV